MRSLSLLGKQEDLGYIRCSNTLMGKIKNNYNIKEVHLMKYTTDLLLVLFTLSATCTTAHGSRLADAVKSGNIERVKQLIKKGADVNGLDKHDLHRTLLDQVAESGNTDIARLLLKNGAKVNQTKEVQIYDLGITEVYVRSSPLFYAAGKGHLEMCRLLISYGANINPTINGKPDPFRSTRRPLLAAARIGHLEVCKFLIEKGANVNFESAPNPTWCGVEVMSLLFYLKKVSLSKDPSLALDFQAIINLFIENGAIEWSYYDESRFFKALRNSDSEASRLRRLRKNGAKVN